MTVLKNIENPRVWHILIRWGKPPLRQPHQLKDWQQPPVQHQPRNCNLIGTAPALFDCLDPNPCPVCKPCSNNFKR